jgi:predicted MFS family arabinose efflux permease
MAMVIAAVPAFVLLPALLFLHEPERGASETHSYKEAPASMFSVLRIPTLWWIVASGALLNFNMYAIGTFMPALLGRIHGLKVGPAGIATGILYLTGGIAEERWRDGSATGLSIDRRTGGWWRRR